MSLSPTSRPFSTRCSFSVSETTQTVEWSVCWGIDFSLDDVHWPHTHSITIVRTQETEYKLIMGIQDPVHIATCAAGSRETDLQTECSSISAFKCFRVPSCLGKLIAKPCTCHSRIFCSVTRPPLR